jgi:hypothetical protein
VINVSILVSIKENLITIMNNGNRLLIDKDHELFEKLVILSKDDIKKLYEKDRFNSLLN